LSLPLLLAIPFVFTILVIHFNLPTTAQAKPLAGFTPTPVTPPDGGGGGGSGSGHDDEGGVDKLPPDYVIVQIERCNLSCGGSEITSTASAFKPLAAIDSSDYAFPLFTPVNRPAPATEMLAHVQLIHEGSGWIAEGVISDAKSTRFAVPYPGKWEVFLMSQPEFMTADAIDLTQSNLTELQARLTTGPVSLGSVEANTPEPQLVKCPLACVLPEPPPVEAPPNLPETGGDSSNDLSLARVLVIGGLEMALLGLILWAIIRYRGKETQA
jgi:hypothetical protein